MAQNVEIYGREYDTGRIIAIKTDNDGNLYNNSNLTGFNKINPTPNDTENKLVINDNGSINVVSPALPVSGSYGNIINGITIPGGGDTGEFDLTSGNYKKDCILTVIDSSINLTGYYIISASSDGNRYEFLGIIQPIKYNTGTRGNSTMLNLTPYTHLQIINSSVDDFLFSTISLYSS